MKNIKTILWAVSLSSLLFSCKKDDVSAPTVTLIGNDVVTISLHQAYTEEGATANDTKDGNVSSSVKISGTPDVNNAGVYTVTYEASDKAGNTGSATRTVIVRHTGATIAGSYAVKDSCGSSSTTYVEIVSETNLTRLSVTRFANYDNGTAYFDLSGQTNSTITVPQQTVVCGSIPVARVFTGSGTISSDGKKLIINYTEVTNNTTTSCTGIYTKP